ncbi:MAG TPA: phosphate signaling complex protein PhoU [Steroidobacteraceae bacterium]|nr:phosphate signaling complex protein PhoU [Steroidobacteraceae bacterium]
METADLSHHILSRYNADLEGLRTAVLQMGGLVEQQLQNGVKAVVQGDSRLGEEVARLDHKVNSMEVAIDDDCNRILATRGPTASDLRLIVAIIKSITDLERIGDEAEKLGQAAARLSQLDRASDRYRELKHVGELVTEMVHGALDALARLDTEAALQVARLDRVVDEEYEAIQRQCITFMMEDPRRIRRTIDVLWLARALERVGDHAKNICEYVVYMVLGKDIRHVALEKVEEEMATLRAARNGGSNK